jgi:hypothetical protein
LENGTGVGLTGWFQSKTKSIKIGGAVVGGLGLLVLFLLTTGHTGHVVSSLPFLLILACPLMHVFMHGSHGGHGGSHAGHDMGSTDGP